MAQSPDHEASSVDWIFGIHAVRTLLEDSPTEARRLVLAEGRRSEDVAALAAMAKNAGVRVERAPRQALRRRALRAGFNGNHQGVAVQRSTFAPASEKELEARWPTFDNPLVVVLDGIEDAGNSALACAPRPRLAPMRYCCRGVVRHRFPASRQRRQAVPWSACSSSKWLTWRDV